RLPPAPVKDADSRDPNAALGWMALILPQVDQAPLYGVAEQACRIDPNTLHNPPHVGLATPVPVYVCPDDGRTGPLTDQWGRTVTFTSYLGVAGAIIPSADHALVGVFGNHPGIRLTEVTDGTSQTVAVGERPTPD